jgi:MFS family permease
MRLWAGQTVSELGSVVTRTAVPLVALLALGAGPYEMAYLVVAASLAVLLVGFAAGAWVDRLRRRPVLIWADVIRAFVLFSVPVAYMAGVLRMELLYVVVFPPTFRRSSASIASSRRTASSPRARRLRRSAVPAWVAAWSSSSARRSRSWSTPSRSSCRRSRSS